LFGRLFIAARLGAPGIRVAPYQDGGELPIHATRPALIGTREGAMNNIFYIIGVVVVVLVILSYFGLR
jgi:hypothetical protein